ncbi:MAG: hypothetical protein LBS05_00165 [Tannerellaceae bacterium]|jgi:hypothetical protein|nr:hypothetical protein [Tannerellaceae bacterium]
MSAILFTSFALFALYIILIVEKNRGVPQSISDSFYLKGVGYTFTIWCFAIGFSVAMVMFDASAGRWFQFLGLFAGGGLCFVGTAPYFKSHERTVHFTSAATCAVAAAAWMCAAGYAPALIPVLIVALAVRQNRMFWSEITIFLMTYTSLYLHLNQV